MADTFSENASDIRAAINSTCERLPEAELRAILDFIDTRTGERWQAKFPIPLKTKPKRLRIAIARACEKLDEGELEQVYGAVESQALGLIERIDDAIETLKRSEGAEDIE